MLPILPGIAQVYLEVPQEAKVVALTPLGFPESASLIRPVTKDERKTEGEVFGVNRFSQ
jgi:hypothetical protein